MNNKVKIILPIVTAFAVSLSVASNVVAQEENNESTSSASVSPTPSPTPDSDENCIATDVHGYFDHSNTTPVTGHFYNAATNQTCSDTLWVLVYGTNEDPSSPSFIDSQKYITTFEVNVTQGATDQVETFNAPETEYCVLQYDLMDSPEHPEPPYLYTRDSIAVTKDNCDTVISSPTPTPSTNNDDDDDDDDDNNSQVGGATTTTPQVLAATGAADIYKMLIAGFGMIGSGIWLLKGKKGTKVSKGTKGSRVK